MCISCTVCETGIYITCKCTYMNCIYFIPPMYLRIIIKNSLFQAKSQPCLTNVVGLSVELFIILTDICKVVTSSHTSPCLWKLVTR